MITLSLLLLIFLDRLVEGRIFSNWLKQWKREGCYYRETDVREVAYPQGYKWGVFIDEETGDRDVMPLGEDHIYGPDCICKPKVELLGAFVLTTHNSFDHREVIEEAIDIMNGVR